MTSMSIARSPRTLALMFALMVAAGCGIDPEPRTGKTPKRPEETPARTSTQVTPPGTIVAFRCAIPEGVGWRLHELQTFASDGEERESQLLTRWTRVDESGHPQAGSLRIERLRTRREPNETASPSEFEGLDLEIAFEGAEPRLVLVREGRGRDLSAQLLAERARLRVLGGRSILLPTTENVAVGATWTVPIYDFVQASGLGMVLLQPRGSVQVTLRDHDPALGMATLSFAVDLESAPSGLSFHLEGETQLDPSLGIPAEEHSTGWIRIGGAKPREFERRTQITRVDPEN